MSRLTYFVMLMLTACAPVGGVVKSSGRPIAEGASGTDKTFGEAWLQPYKRPKARVAVYRFTDQTAKKKGVARGLDWYTEEIGDAMANMLSDGLINKSDRFIVLEHQAIQDTLREQDLRVAGWINKETGTPVGQIEGAELVIKGTVTEFEPGSSARGTGTGGSGFFSWPPAIAGGSFLKSRQSRVAMDIQIVDARTSSILFSTTVEGKADDFNVGGALAGFGDVGNGLGGLGVWQKTPVDKALRIAMLQAVKEISRKTPGTYFRRPDEVVAVAPAPPAPARVQEEPPPLAAKPTVSTQPTEPSLPTLVVKVRSANLRSAAGTQAKIVTSLKRGRKLTMLEEVKGWCHVRTENGKEGWILKSLTDP